MGKYQPITLTVVQERAVRRSSLSRHVVVMASY